MIASVSIHKLTSHQMDVRTAGLNIDLEVMRMDQLEAFVLPGQKIKILIHKILV